MIPSRSAEAGAPEEPLRAIVVAVELEGQLVLLGDGL